MLGKRPRHQRHNRRRGGPFTWEQVQERTLAIYRAEAAGRERTAIIVWQGDDPRVEIGGQAPPLLVTTVDAEYEAGEHNQIAMRGFESLESARAHALDWTGTTDLAQWDELGEAAQVGTYAAIRDPDFAPAD